MYPAPSAKKAALLTHTVLNSNQCCPELKRAHHKKLQVTKLRLLNSALTQCEWTSKLPHFRNTEAGEGNSIGQL